MRRTAASLQRSLESIDFFEGWPAAATARARRIELYLKRALEEPDVARWANTSEAVLEQALLDAQPPAAQAFADSLRPHATSGRMSKPSIVPPIRSHGKLIGFAVGAVAVVVAVTALLLR